MAIHHAAVVRATVAATSIFVSTHALPEVSPRLTLVQAVEQALGRSPALRAHRAEVEQAEARLITARVYPHDPEVTVEAAHRTNGDTTTDRHFALAQEIEIGGQRRRRIVEAATDLDSSRARLLRQEHLLRARVRAAFAQALRMRALLEVETASTDLARTLSDVAERRLESGAAAQMEVNLAQVQLGRAIRDLKVTSAGYGVAKALLAEVVGLDPMRPPEPEGRLGPLSRRLPSDADLLELALAHRADLESFRKASESALARIELAKREVIPNLELQAFHGEEEGTDRLTGAGITVRIPLFNRNQGRIAEESAVHRQVLAEADALEAQVRQEVASSLARYRALREASEELQRQALSTLQDNLGLLQRSFEVGKTSWTEVLVFRREFVDIQRDHIETLSDATLAEIELDLATGLLPDLTDEEPQP